MRTAKVKVYSFDELSDEAKARAHADWLSRGHEHFWAGDARDTMKAFEEEFGVTIRNWRYDSSGYNFDLDLSGISDEVLQLSGNRARSWIWNNHGDILLEPTTHYYEINDGKRYNVVGPHSRKYRSKVFYTRVYDGTCPLTGVCFDCDALDPIAYFAFGVEWSDKERKRVAGNRKLSIDNATTVEDILRDCVDSLFYALQRDCESQESIEYFADHCAANNYEFTEDCEIFRHGEIAA